MYEKYCPECNQIHDEGHFTHGRGICDYCYAIMGLDHSFERYEGNLFGEIAGAGSTNIKFTGWWDR